MTMMFFPSGVPAFELPADRNTAGNLVALSGKTCPLKLDFYPSGGIIPTGKFITLSSVALHTIANTKDLLAFTTPSGKTLTASATGSCGSPLSIGSAGTFNVGVVNANNDISFHICNGVFSADCIFQTAPSLTVRKGWTIMADNWKGDSDGAIYLEPVHFVVLALRRH